MHRSVITLKSRDHQHQDLHPAPAKGSNTVNMEDGGMFLHPARDLHSRERQTVALSCSLASPCSTAFASPPLPWACFPHALH